MDFRHRPPEYGIHPCHLFLVESNTTVQGKFHRDLLYTYSINGHYLFQTVCQEDPPLVVSVCSAGAEQLQRRGKISPVKDILIHCCSLIDKLVINN